MADNRDAVKNLEAKAGCVLLAQKLKAEVGCIVIYVNEGQAFGMASYGVNEAKGAWMSRLGDYLLDAARVFFDNEMGRGGGG